MFKKIISTLTAILLFLFIPKANFSFPSNEGEYSLKTVVIDAGHGGSDAGCLGSNSKEKYISFDIAMMLGDLIKAQAPGVKVIYTRETDDFIPLHERAAIANNNKADLFISIHLNENVDKTISGTETYLLGLTKTSDNTELAMRENKVITDENKIRENYGDFNPDLREAVATISTQKDTSVYNESMAFATAVEDQFSNAAKRTSRGVKQAGLLILHNVYMPAVMIQLGFLSNLDEEKDIKSSLVKDKVATAIYQAFKKYKDQTETKRKYEAEARKRLEEETKRKLEEENKRKQEEEIAKANAQKIADSIAAEPKARVEENKPGRLSTPCYIIGCSATPTEPSAKSNMLDLQKKGFDAGYFWIPDYTKGGKNLYKVYVGPFISQDKANMVLKEVKRYISGAYVMFLE